MLYWLFTTGRTLFFYSIIPGVGLSVVLFIRAAARQHAPQAPGSPREKRQRRTARLAAWLAALSVLQSGVTTVGGLAVRPGYSRAGGELAETLAALLIGPPTIDRTRLLMVSGLLSLLALLAARLVSEQLREGSPLRDTLELRHDPPRMRDELGSAHFCTPREYRRFRQADPQGWTLHGAFWGRAVGGPPRRFIRLDDGEGRFCLSGEDVARGFLVLGGPGSGKTQSVILPAVADRMAAGHSVVVADPQGELRPILLRLAAVTGHPVLIHDPTNPTSSRFNLAHALQTVSEAKAIAEVLLPGSQPGNFWHDSASALCAACLLRFETIGDVLEATIDMGHLAEALASQDDPARRLAASFIANAQGEGQRTAAGTLSTLVTAIDGWADEAVCRATAASDFGADDLVRVPSVLLLTCPGRQRAVYARYLGGVLRKLILDLDAIGEGSADGALPQPVAVVLDEFPALGRLDGMVQDVNLVRKRRISFVIAAQTKGQFHLIYGRDGTDALLSGLATQLVFGGCDQETADFFSHASGTTTETLPGREPKRTISRRLVTPDEIQTPARGSATLFARYTTHSYATQLVMLARPTRLYQREDWQRRLTGMREQDALLVAQAGIASDDLRRGKSRSTVEMTAVEEWVHGGDKAREQN